MTKGCPPCRRAHADAYFTLCRSKGEIFVIFINLSYKLLTFWVLFPVASGAFKKIDWDRFI